MREGKDFTIQKVLDLEESFLEKTQGIPGKDLAGLQAQIASVNCLEFRKILFRQDVGRDAEEWAEMAGTFTSRKQTYQIIRDRNRKGDDRNGKRSGGQRNEE